MKRNFLVQLVCALAFVTLVSCSKDEVVPPEIPTLITGEIETGYISASIAGSIDSNNGSPVTKMGVCWSLSPSPTVNDFKKEFEGADGFSGEVITDLELNTTYYVRTYAINGVGVGYGVEKSFKTLSTVKDVEGNEYNAVKINNKVWMAADLKTTKYSNGDNIPTTTANIESENEPKYQWVYDNDNANLSYGRLYTWYVATDSRNVCPSGWHVPSYAELELLGSSAYAMRETGTTVWQDNNGTNTTGFNAKGSGIRFSSAEFGQLNAYWLPLSSDTDPGYALNVKTKTISIYYGDTFTDINQRKNDGFSIRCVKD